MAVNDFLDFSRPFNPGAVDLPAAPRPAPTIPPLAPEEESSVLERLGHGALSGLAWLGSSLGKALGGRAIRGALGGKPRELASIIPFSDTLGITDPADEVHGAELLGNRHADFLSPEGLGGLGLDILLDPATYLTFGTGALSRAGRVAQRAGILPETMAGRIGTTLGDLTTATNMSGLGRATQTAANVGDTARAMGLKLGDILHEPLGGVAGLRLPFTEPTALLGTGPIGQKVGSYLDTALDKLKYSAPVRQLSALFDPSVGGATTEVGQRAARAGAETFRQGQAAVRAKQLDVLRTLQEHDALGTGQLLRQAVELGPESLASSFHGPFLPGTDAASLAPVQGLTQAAGKVRSYLDEMLAHENALGIPTKFLTNYFPRYKTVLAKDTGGFSSGARQTFPTGHPSLVGREDVLMDIPGGTVLGVNPLLQDPELKALVGGKVLPEAAADTKPLLAAARIREKYLGMTPADEANMFQLAQKAKGGTPLSPNEQMIYDIAKGKWDKSQDLTGLLRSLDPQYAAAGLDFFGNHPGTDLLTRGLYHERAIAGTNAIHDMLAKVATTPDLAEAGSIPLRQVLINAGLAESGQLTHGAHTTMVQRLLKEGVDLSQPGAFDKLYVPAKVAEDAARYQRAVSSPAGLEPFLKAFDAVTNFTKAMQTTVWPAFHSRNFVTGMFMNWITGAADPRHSPLSPAAYLQPIKEAAALRSGAKVIDEANKIKGLEHLTPEQATRALADEIYVQRVTGHKVLSDITGQGQHVAQQGLPVLPGEGAPGFADLLKGAIPKTREQANPLNIAGVGSNVDLFAPVKAGRQIGEMADDVNRMAAYIARRRQGYTPEMAAMETKASHYDYSSLTGFERNTMRRLIPFYNWMQNNVPFMVQQLAKEPGGKLATVIKAAGEARGSEPGFLPSYLGQGLALPLGAPQEGTTRFLSHTGLPFEDFAQGLGVQGLLGSLNPMLKAPAELATGRQFFTGRDLADLHTMTGGTLGDQLLMNSPLSRFATTGRTLADERKGMLSKAVNLFTGSHLTDVDMQKARDIAVREMIDQATRGDRNVGRFERLYVRPENLANLSPEELLLLRLNATREAAHRQQALR